MCKELKINIEFQGAPVVGPGYVVKEYDDLVLLEIDLTSKYCRVCITGSGGDEGVTLGLEATEASLHLQEGKDRGDITFLEFPEYKENWRVACAVVSRYTLTVCLNKDNT